MRFDAKAATRISGTESKISHKSVRGYFAAIAIFLAVATGLLWLPIRRGLSLVPWQLSYVLDPVYKPGAESVLRAYPNNSILFDLAFQFYPWSTYTLARISEWSLPLWNPYSLAGIPFLANHQSGVFEITKLAGYLLGLRPTALPLLTWFLTLVMAALFTYAFVRNLGLGFAASVVGGVVYAFSGPMVVWLGWPHSSTAMWLPFLLLTIDKIIKTGSLHWLGLFAVGLAFLIFAGHIQVAWLVLMTVTAWAVFRLGMVSGWRQRLGLVCRLAVGGFLGLGLAGVQLLPTLEFIRQSVVIQVGRGGKHGAYGFIDTLASGRWLWPHDYHGLRNALNELILFVFPDFFGNWQTQYWKQFGNYSETAVYVGITALALVVSAAICNREHRRVIIFWGAIALTGTGIALALPVIGTLSYLPVLRLANMGRTRFMVVFALAVLAAIGFETLTAPPKSTPKRPSSLRVFVAAQIALAGTVWIATHLDSHWVRASSVLVKNLARGEDRILLALLAGAVGVAALLRTNNAGARKIGSATLAAMVVAELLMYGSAYHRGLAPELVASGKPVISYLKDRAGIDRISSFKTTTARGAALFPNTSVVFGLQDVRGYEVIQVGRFERLQQLVVGPSDPRITYIKYNRDFFNLLGVKYFLQADQDPEAAVLEGEGLRRVYHGGGISVFRNDAALPRAFLTYRTRRVGAPEQALHKFKHGLIDFKKEALIESGPRLTGPGGVDRVRVVSYMPESVELKVNAAQTGLLVLTDTFIDGWEAYVDGRRTKLYPADIAFRGVVVAPGRHRVRFVYRPPALRLAFYLFWPSIIAVVSLIVVGLRRRAGNAAHLPSGD